ncbi:HD domain-containing protein [Neolecta irregularis DAH-3]|uniref:5'-deoxynucleotidase n=1 Tax=Neolecta irregularis (strain DAH-3) TaxID=1198029 RepID=A0A1U7LL07_NEOID|nr:HD domain-containing protein [Neolecta irregularis DAH-3]|eukprot:OLL23340.1 HD domain-containing protein [Neolecta irregularis DAH-3]
MSLLPYLSILRNLKTTGRTGWLNHGIPHPESIADHMYRMAMICVSACPPALDQHRCIKIALVHDVAEAIVGDITPVDGISKEEKHRLEKDAFDHIARLLPHSSATDILALWNEYEAAATPEALFVKDVDKYELLLQTLEYEKQYGGFKDLGVFISARNAISTDIVKSWADEIIHLRLQFWSALNKEIAQDGSIIGGPLH